MEAVTQILEAEDLVSIMHIPLEMRHRRIEVTLRPIEKSTENNHETQKINMEVMHKFIKSAETGEAKEHLKKKVAEGAQFDFDVLKLVNGTMTEV